MENTEETRLPELSLARRPMGPYAGKKSQESRKTTLFWHLFPFVQG